MAEQKKQLTEMQQAFLDALGGDAKGDIRQAMKMAGYSAGTRTRDVLHPLRDEIIDVAATLLAANATKAAFGMIDTIDDPNALGAKNKVAAAKEVLDRAGLVKKEKVEVESSGGGIFILPPKASE